MSSISFKKFNDQAKKIKRKKYLTADDARDVVAQQHGFESFAVMRQSQVRDGVWK